jgi:hypothetical protein
VLASVSAVKWHVSDGDSAVSDSAVEPVRSRLPLRRSRSARAGRPLAFFWGATLHASSAGCWRLGWACRLGKTESLLELLWGHARVRWLCALGAFRGPRPCCSVLLGRWREVEVSGNSGEMAFK